MDLQEAFGSSAAVELVDVLGDDRDLATLPAESLLTLCDGLVGGVGLLGEHDLTAVVVKLPNAGRIPGEGLWSGETLEDQTKKRFSRRRKSSRLVAKRRCSYVRIRYSDDDDDTCACHFLQ